MFSMRSTFIFLIVLTFISSANIAAIGQDSTKSDSTKTQVTYNQPDSTFMMDADTAVIQHNVDAALDIASDRGIFILSSDKKLQLRILGSVRANFNYTDQDLPDHQTFNPYEIPTDIDNRAPNFYAGVEQTRLGFEVTRHTKSNNDVFIRIEGDFKNSSIAFRIRHAYGQFQNLLVGQTWSLFANVHYQPAFVSMDGPVGGSGVRTPQIRYSHSFAKNMVIAGAIEYAFDDFDVPDSIGTALQVIPDFTAQFSFKKSKYSFRLAAIVRTLSGRTDSNDISYSFGFGGSFAGKMKVKKNGELFLTATYGNAISSYLDVWAGRNENMSYDAENKTFEALFSLSGYLAYSQSLPKDFSASIGLGFGSIYNKDYQPDDAYNYSYNALLTVFWVPVEGARLGLEFTNGQRWDKGGERGAANRVSMLLYYDF